MAAVPRAAVVGLAVIAMACPDAGASAAVSLFDNTLIARVALGYVGHWGGQACVDADHAAFGQCKQFVNCVVSIVSGGRAYPVDPGGDYQASYADVGGTEVDPDEAVAGDIIQLGSHDGDRSLHSAIVLTNHRDGTYSVVDANYVGWPRTPEMVGVHEWTPPFGARFWRLGAPAATPTADLSALITAAESRLPGPLPSAPTLTAAVPGGLAFGPVPVTLSVPAAGTPATAERVYVDVQLYTTWPATGPTQTHLFDTTGVLDGTHRITARAVTVLGTTSEPGPALTLTVVNHTPAVAAAEPSGPIAGQVTLLMFTSPAADGDPMIVTLDGRPSATPGLSIDTATLPPGRHLVTVTALDANGHAAAVSTPITLTTALRPMPRATGGFGTLDDPIALDSVRRMLRYPAPVSHVLVTTRAAVTAGQPELTTGFPTVEP